LSKKENEKKRQEEKYESEGEAFMMLCARESLAPKMV
jgi:hypothetical protein